MKIISLSGGSVSPEIENDYSSAPVFDRLRIGKTGVFLPSGFKVKYIPYDCFDRAYVMVHETRARMCCASTDFEYYRMVFMNGEACTADFMSENKEAMHAALDQLRASAPEITVGAAYHAGESQA